MRFDQRLHLLTAARVSTWRGYGLLRGESIDVCVFWIVPERIDQGIDYRDRFSAERGIAHTPDDKSSSVSMATHNCRDATKRDGSNASRV